MTKGIVLVLAVSLLAACSSSSGSVEESPLLSTEGIMSDASGIEGPQSSGTLSRAWSDHLRGCRAGWDFTISSLARGAARDAARLENLFR